MSDISTPALAARCRELAEVASAADARPMATWLQPLAEGRTAKQALAEAAALAWDLDRQVAALAIADPETPPAPPVRRTDRERRPVKVLIRETRECLLRAAGRLESLPPGTDAPDSFDAGSARLSALLAMPGS